MINIKTLVEVFFRLTAHKIDADGGDKEDNAGELLECRNIVYLVSDKLSIYVLLILLAQQKRLSGRTRS